jgi:hypothetical protein
MSQWKYWQNEHGVYIGNHFPRKTGTHEAEISPRESHSPRAHNGSVAIRNVNRSGKTNTTINTFGDSGKWTIAFRYRLRDFSSSSSLLFSFQGVSNANKVEFFSPQSASVSAQFQIYGSNGTTINTFDWDLTGVFYTSDTNSRREWAHFVVTYDSSQAAADELTFYTYGIETVPTSTTINGSTNQTNTDRFLQIGNPLSGAAPANYQELAVWEGVTLTPDEVKAIYNHGLSGFDLQSNRDGYISAENLVNWFRFGHSGVSDEHAADFLNSNYDLFDNAFVWTDLISASAATPTGSWITFDGTERFEANNGGTGRQLNFADEWTISAWIRPQGGVGVTYFLDVDDAATSGQNRIRLGYDSTGAGVGFECEATSNDGGTTRTATVSASNEQTWRQVVAVKSAGGGVTLYQNGVAGTATSSLTMTDSARSIAIGDEIGSGNAWTGDVHSVAIWNKAMTSAEVVVLFNEGDAGLELRRSFKGLRLANSLQNWWWLGQPAQSSETGNNLIVDRGHGTHIDLSEDATGGLNRSFVHTDRALSPYSRPLIGTYMRLDGASELLQSNGRINLGIGNSWTISWALRTSSVSSMSAATIFDFISVLNFDRIRIRLRGDLSNDPLEITLWTSAGGAIKNYRWNSLLSDNQWVLLVATWDGTDLLLWADGQRIVPTTKVTDNSGTMGTLTRQVTIGSVVAGWNGDISYLALWSSNNNASVRQITTKTPKLDYTTDVDGYNLSSELQHWWNFFSDPDTIGRNHVQGKEDLDQNTGSIDSGSNSGAEGF